MPSQVAPASCLLFVAAGQGDGGRAGQETRAGAGSGQAVPAEERQQRKQQLRAGRGEERRGEQSSQYYCIIVSLAPPNIRYFVKNFNFPKASLPIPPHRPTTTMSTENNWSEGQDSAVTRSAGPQAPVWSCFLNILANFSRETQPGGWWAGKLYLRKGFSPGSCFVWQLCSLFVPAGRRGAR